MCLYTFVCIVVYAHIYFVTLLNAFSIAKKLLLVNPAIICTYISCSCVNKYVCIYIYIHVVVHTSYIVYVCA